MSQRPEDPKAVCENCRHFSHYGYNGACHRNPPVTSPDGRGRFPMMGLYDWCGEFAPRKEPA